MMNKKGFTLVELMVVIVIIGVLAAVAIPKFSAAVNKAKASEMPSVMSQIQTAQAVYLTETNVFASAQDHSELKTNLGVDVANQKYFSYEVALSNSDLTYAAEAMVTSNLGDILASDNAEVTMTETHEGVVTVSSSGTNDDVLIGYVRSWYNNTPSN